MDREERRRLRKQGHEDGPLLPAPGMEEVGRYFNAGNFEAAGEILEEILSVDPKNFEGNFGLGLVRAAEGKAAMAVSFFKTAAAVRPRDAEAHFNLGLALFQTGEPEEAAAAYRRSIEIAPNAATWLNLGILYQDTGDLAAAASYAKAIDINPRQAQAHNNLGNVRAQAGDREGAIRSYETALEIDPGNAAARSQLNAARARTIQGWHLPMLADTARNDAYEKAITQAVKKKKGAHVLDIGTGSGLLAMMAARAGAETVTACEINIPLADIARQVVSENGFADQITVIGKSSEKLVVGKDMARPADIIVSEIVDVGLLREGVLTTLSHAVQTLAAKGAEMIPASAEILAVLVEAPALRRVNPLSEISGFDLSAFDVFRDPGYRKIFLANQEHKLLSRPFPVAAFDFRTFRPGDPNHFDTLELEAEILEDGAAQAVVFWFELRLDEETVISTSPASGKTHWGQAIQFLDTDIPVCKGDRQAVTALLGIQEISFFLPVGKKTN